MAIKFDPKELVIINETQTFSNRPVAPVYSFPVSMKEGVKEALSRRPIWQLTGVETSYFAPAVNPDNIARAFVMDGSGFGFGKGGGPDMFGIEWEYVAVVGGSMVRPGKPALEDANDWEDIIKFPDFTKWDWEKAAEQNKNFLSDEKYNCCWQQNGFFERLVSFMEFENAAFALVDDEQQDAVKALFMKLADMYIEMFDLYLKHFPKIDGFFFHDDWGSQKETFFSPALAAELIVPAMKKVTDFMHSRGKFAELHSCGQLMKQVPNMKTAGWDTWSGQLMNDSAKEYELYGDGWCMGVLPEQLDYAAMPEAEQRSRARDYAAKFCNPDKPSTFGQYGTFALTPAFREELYIASREAYAQ